MNIFKTFIKKVHFTYLEIISMYGSRQIKKNILKYYSKHPTQDKEITDTLNYLKTHGISTFPDPFKDRYIEKNIAVHTDKSNGLYYIIRNGRRLYFRRSKTFKGTQHTYNSLLIEQDVESPHRYLTNEFNIGENDVLVDIGCAEGILSLDLIDKVRKVYLFECEEEWIEALKHTFDPWKDKVEIIRKFVSDTNDDNSITLDSFFKNRQEKPTFIKIDVEGAEMKVLRGMQSLLKESRMKLAICTYHRQNDYEVITDYVAKQKISYSTSEKYMFFAGPGGCVPPYFRRGLIRADNFQEQQTTNP